MISHDLATAIANLVGEALDQLLRAQVAVEVVPATDTVAVHMDPVAAAVANAAGILARIEDEYPELHGPDVPFRDAVPPSTRREMIDVAQGGLREAMARLQQARSILDVEPGADTGVEGLFRYRLQESIEILRTALLELSRT